MGTRHKHTRFINACVKYLKENNSTETSVGLIDKVRTNTGSEYQNKPTVNQLSQLLARDERVKQISGFSSKLSRDDSSFSDRSKLAHWRHKDA